MTFTYDITTDRGEVRFNIGDTSESTEWALTDAEIDMALTKYNNSIPLASYYAHTGLLARLAGFIGSSAGGVDNRMSQLFEHHKQLHIELRNAAKLGQTRPYAGQIESDRITDAKEDTSFEQPKFRVGQDDYYSEDADNVD